MPPSNRVEVGILDADYAAAGATVTADAVNGFPAHTGDARADQTLSSLKEKLIKIGAKVISMAAASPSRWPWSPLPAKCSRDFAAEC